MNTASRRPLPLGQLRAFDAVARHLAFGVAADELHLTQPAISRQIRALEDALGQPLFLRGTRRVELTQAGQTLWRSVGPWLDRLDQTVQQLRRGMARRHVAVTTFASFASHWLLPRLPAFQQQHPGIDIRISASDAMVELDDAELDLALRYCAVRDAPAGAVKLFDEVVTPVAAPALLERLPLRRVADLSQHVLIEDDDGRPSAEWVAWSRWLQTHDGRAVEPQGWVYLNYTYQKVQAALAGQGVALARWPMVAEALARGDLVEPFGAAGRVAVPFAYWLIAWPGASVRPEVAAFAEWLHEQGRATAQTIDQALAGLAAVR